MFNNFFFLLNNDNEIFGELSQVFSLVNFAVPADHRVKIKENKIMDKYLDLARELKEV